MPPWSTIATTGANLAIRYSERLADAGITPSAGAVGDAYDDTLAETINGLYKTEVIRHRGPWKGLDALEYATLEWVQAPTPNGLCHRSVMSHLLNMSRHAILSKSFGSSSSDSHNNVTGEPSSAAISDAVRELLILEQTSFGFETVRSHLSKVDLLKKDHDCGFRVYLNFVSTGDPLLNVARVRQRVQEGGHDVPEHRTLERYGRSLDLLSSAVRASDRAYVFDSTGPSLQLVASVTAGRHIEIHHETGPE